MTPEHLQRYVADNYPSAYRLVTDGGRLTENWSNVATHCFLQTLAAEVFGGLLGLEQRSIDRLARTAASHDWRKRLDKCVDDFDASSIALANQLLSDANLDNELMAALEPSFLVVALEGRASFLQLVQFLIDDMTMNDRFVTFEERVQEAQERTPDPDPQIREILGRPSYWDAEREVGYAVEKMVLAICAARRQEIETSQELVRYVNHEIQMRLEAKYG